MTNIPSNNAPQKPAGGPVKEVVKHVPQYPAGKDSREGAASRSQDHKQRELVRRGADPKDAAKHARNMIPRQSTGDPNGNPSY